MLFFSYFSSLYKFFFFLTKLDAALGIAGGIRGNIGEYSDFDIPTRSQVYVDTPSEVFVGTLEFFSNNLYPDWIGAPHREENDEDRVYVRMYGGIGLIANLVPFHNNTHSHHQPGYYCYIPLSNNILLFSYLRDNDYALNRWRSTRVVVRIPSQAPHIFSGVLEPLHDYRPLWLPNDNLRSRPRH